MLESKSENNVLFGIALVFVILGSFALLGFIGLRTVSGFVILVFLPFYLIFENLNLLPGEKIAFSFFASIMLFPSLVYWLGFVVSFKAAIFIIFIILLLASYIIRKFVKK